MPVAAPSLRSAWPVAQQFTNFGARTGRARQNRFAQAKVGANGFPFARSLGRTHCQWLRRLRLHAPPMASPPAPWLCGEWQSKRFANGLVRSSFAGRALCAPPRQGIGLAQGQAHRKDAPATGTGCERPGDSPKPFAPPPPQKTFFFQLFHVPPCAVPPNVLHYCPSNPRIASANGCRAAPLGTALAFSGRKE